MRKPADIKKTPTGRVELASIVKRIARAVAYTALALGIVAGVASCAHWHQQTAFDCNAKPEGCL